MFTIAAALAAITFQPASAQVATQADIEILERKIMDLDFRLRTLEGEKEAKRQAEQQAEKKRQNDAEWEIWRNCRAYRQRIAAAPPADPKRAGAEELRMIDQLDEDSCKHADKFEADNAAKVRAMDQKKR